MNKMGEKIKDMLELRERIKGRSKSIFGNDIFSARPHDVTVRADHLDDLFFKTVLATLEHGSLNYINKGSYEGTHRLELEHAHLIAEKQRDPITNSFLPQTRPGMPAPTDEPALDKYFNKYIIGDEIEKNEHYTYASWIVGMKKLVEGPRGGKKYVPLTYKGIPRGTRLNQLEWCAKHFVESVDKETGNYYGTNHCYITVGCAEGLQRYDWPYEDDTDRGTSECLRGLSLKIQPDDQGVHRLNLTAFFRSWDMFSGLAENLGGVSKFMEYFSNMVNIKKEDHMPEVKPGVLYANSDGLHIYEHSLEVAPLWVGLDLK